MDSRHSSGKCNHSCLMSRRCFLGAVSAGAAAVPAIAAAARKAPAPPPGDLAEHIDLSAFRPKPEVRILAAVIRRPPPYWLGWPGTSYDLEKHRKAYETAFAQSAKRVGVALTQIESPLENDQAVLTFIKEITDTKPDAVLVSLQHLDVWAWAGQIAKAGVPTIVFSPVGTAFTGHVLQISRQPGIHVISSLESAAVEQAMRMVRAKKQFETSRLLVVAGTERKADTLVEGLGTKVRYVPRPTLNELFARMPETDEVREVAKHMRRGAEKVVEPKPADFLNSARSFATAKRLLKDEEANAITT
ncbi:MAG: hypothetical protein HZB26_18335, partial [Candidatus Hydrogenedentes bacterium]|nr:hypothetical protein [Candidatus Hydrogenedentota bacterium]